MTEPQVVCEQPYRKGIFGKGKSNRIQKGKFIVYCSCGRDYSVETQLPEQSWRCGRCRRVYNLVSPIEETTE